MRLPLLLVLLSLPAAAAANPVEAWAQEACPAAKDAHRYARMRCLKDAAWTLAKQEPEQERQKQGKLEDLREALRSAVLSWALRMCELRGDLSELDLASHRVQRRGPRGIEERFTCQTQVHAWTGHFLHALERRDAKALAENLAELERTARPGGELTLRQAAVAKLLAAKVAPKPDPEDGLYSRERWEWTVTELVHVRRLPARIAALRCKLHSQRDVMMPPRCEERTRRALESELWPLAQALSKAASTLPAAELDAAEKELASQETAWGREQAQASPDRLFFERSTDESQVEPYRDGMDRPEKVRGELPPGAMKRPGPLMVTCTVLTSGELTYCRLLKSFPGMVEEAVLDSVRTWRFTPARLNGQPIAVDFLIAMKP